MLREQIQMGLAVMLIVSGIILCYAAFFRSQEGVISDSVLAYMGECLIWSGSMFGMKSYVDFRLHRHGQK